MAEPSGEWESIRSKFVLAVEGTDEKHFFDALLRYMKITDVAIREVGGKHKFPKTLATLRKPREFDDITHLAIVRDKDSDDAFRSIKNILKKEGLPVPDKPGEFSEGTPKVGVFIMPGESIEGTMLEDLCLKTVEGHPAMQCVDEFTSCVSALETVPKNISKAKAQAFLASQSETVGSVGLGAQKRYWNFDSAVLDELKDFLGHLR